MFTGLIEHMGTITSIETLDSTESGGGGWSMTISDSAVILEDCHIGDSIACNGVCLTVTKFDRDSFKVGVAPETLERTNLGDLKVGNKINLERALAAHVRFGGHFVQGHVDGTATIISVTPDQNSLRFLFQLPQPTPTRPSLLPYLIEKGFIGLDGTSLTLTSVDDNERTFGVMLIAHTQHKIVLATKKVGEKVNVEVDMVGKYVEKSVLSALGGASGEGIKALIERIVDKRLDSRAT